MGNLKLNSLSTPDWYIHNQLDISNTLDKLDMRRVENRTEIYIAIR